VTALPVPEPPRVTLLTADAYTELGEDDRYRSELQEGNLVMSPGPVPDDMIDLAKLLVQLHEQLPLGLRVIPDIDVNLELAPPDKPGFVRRPDLIVVDESAVHRVRNESGILRASDVLIVVEIVSLGSYRTDHVVKRGEYADAGIPHYWIVDLEPPATLLACHLAGEFGYQDPGPVTGAFTTTELFPVKVKLDALVPA
jgi:Uma2 family endonuclease